MNTIDDMGCKYIYNRRFIRMMIEAIECCKNQNCEKCPIQDNKDVERCRNDMLDSVKDILECLNITTR